jgi:hypothetical protein
VYAREIDGQEYDFGVSGKLIMNVLVMYDRQTNTYWSQLLGEAVEGPLKGTQLEYLASWQTTWSEWREQHPDTLAIDKGTRSSSDSYESYYLSGQAGVLGETISDDRLYTKEWVIGVDWNGEQVAYPFSRLSDTPVVNDTVGGTDVLVLFNADSATGIVFDRQVDGQSLTFEPTGDGLTLTDTQTGSTWDGWNGVATAGPLEGRTLSRVRSTSSFWFGWKDWFPNTRVYGDEEPE